MNTIRKVIGLILFFCLCLTGGLLWLSTQDVRSQNELQENIACYKPAATAVQTDLAVNQSVVDLQSQYPDVLGWLTLDATTIDYPFVQSRDNEDYLRTDLNGESVRAGTIFVDYRCNGTDSFMTILYGHNMKNGTMFSDLDKFGDEEFWDKHTAGTLYLANQTYHLESIAFLVVGSSDPQIYAPGICSENDISAFSDYLAQNARRYRETTLTGHDKILVLSTCNDEFTEARSVVVLKMIKTA